MSQVPFCSFSHRRHFLRTALLGSAPLFIVPGAFAEALTRTPRQTEGPFYPDKLPLDTDNDLIILNDAVTPAVGEITHLSGTVRDVKGEPVRNAVVEIWQVDCHGSYIHSRGANRANERDGNFQGYGRFLTGSKGEYYFRTIKPEPYGPRTAHIHVAVSRGGKRVLTTQCYIAGHPKNAGDFLLNRVPEENRGLLIVEFAPLPDSDAGELAARFDMVVGMTPEDPKGDRGRRFDRR